jgi:hypothetical protein
MMKLACAGFFVAAGFLENFREVPRTHVRNQAKIL